jgi:hypothetical protein
MTRLILKFSLPVRRLPSPSRLLITSFFCTEETSASHGLFSLAIMDEVITSLFFAFMYENSRLFAGYGNAMYGKSISNKGPYNL